MQPIYKSAKRLGVEKLWSLPTISLSRSLTSVVPPLIRYVLAVDDAFLYLAAEAITSPHFEKCAPGEFREGLSEQDVIEVFIKDDGEQSYQEFNLSPCGAWWSCVFSAPRVGATSDFGSLEVETISVVGADKWRVSAAFPLECLKIKCSFSNSSRLLVCACLGEDPRSYLASSNLPGSEPDFHQPKAFSPVFAITTFAG